MGYSTFKVRRGSGEEMPLVQGKRNPSKTVGVARGHQRVDTLNHNHRKLANLITGPQSCLTHETKSCRVGPPKTDGSWWRGQTECNPLEKVMANHFSILALRTP